MTDQQVPELDFMSGSDMNPNLPIEISMSIREWSLICMALRAKEHDIEDAIEGMPSEAAAAQLTRYAASYTHIRVSLLNALLDAEEQWMDNEAREIAEIEEWREDQ
jgi:hypothetical protein